MTPNGAEMDAILIVLFVITYAAIAFEHPLKINKSASALLGGSLMWAVYALALADPPTVTHDLSETLVSTAQIVFFLIGAMTIVEVVDTHKGFDVVTSRIKTTSLPQLLILVCGVTFFLSAILDNLTTTIVMVSLLSKLLKDRKDRLFFAGLVVIAANSGGAWSPIGDVTTTMLWIGGQITSLSIIQSLILPSVVNLLVPLVYCVLLLRGRLVVPPDAQSGDSSHLMPTGKTSAFERNTMFFLGLGVLVAVPAFKTVTHLPPFVGVLLGVGLMWLVADILHKGKTDKERSKLQLSHALSRIDMSSIIFFIGILMAVATLEHTHILTELAQWLDKTVGRQDVIVMLIGVFSAIVDNVPLVAASMGMYSMETYPVDSFLWTFLAYCAGTGGSILIIGSAAGVAAMGIAKIDFIWYVKNISLLALAGYLAGAFVFIVQYQLGT